MNAIHCTDLEEDGVLEVLFKIRGGKNLFYFLFFSANTFLKNEDIDSKKKKKKIKIKLIYF